MTKKINQILNEYNITTTEDLNLKNSQEQILFLNNLNKLILNNINIKTINNDIKDIILNLKTKNIKNLKNINWKNIEEIIKNNNSKTKNNIYKDILQVIKTELNNNNDFDKDFNIQKNLESKSKKFKADIEFNYTDKGKKTTVNDFILYFNQRLQYFTNLLNTQIKDKEIIRISNLTELYDTNKEVTIIGLISDLKYTKNGHLMITLEDKSGQTQCFINKNKFDKKFKNYDKKLSSIISNLCLDQGIGITGKCGDKIIWADEIITHKTSNTEQTKTTKENNLILTLANLNIGSKYFDYNSFYKFINFTNSKTKDEKLNKIAKSIKYIIINGNIIQGTGSNSSQEKNTIFTSTAYQYKLATILLSKIPQDKCIIITPGTNDITSIYEPQPAIDYNKAYSLYNLPNVIMLSNPSIINLFDEKINILSYYGTSYKYYADNNQELRNQGGLNKSEYIINYLLDKQHLAPTHESTHYIPDGQNDYLKINKKPDIFITGITNKANITNHDTTTIIQNSHWKTIEDNIDSTIKNPDISKCVLINTKTRKSNVLNFKSKK